MLNVYQQSKVKMTKEITRKQLLKARSILDKHAVDKDSMVYDPQTNKFYDKNGEIKNTGHLCR